MVIALHSIALLAYLTAGAVLGRSLAEGRRSAPAVALVAALVASVVHAGALAAYAARFGELPLVGLAPVLSTAAFLVGAGLLPAAAFAESRPVGLVLAPLAAVLIGAALALGIRPTGEELAFRGPWFALHVLLSAIGYSGLAVAFAAGLLYLLQFRELKGKHFGRVFRFFPPLRTLDRLGVRALAVGFTSLTLGLLVGWAWMVRFDRAFSPQEPKVVWGLLTWLIFLAAFGVRLGGPGRDRRAALVSVVGFVIVVLAYVALRFGGAHGRLFL